MEREFSNIIELRNITKTFPGVKALDNVQLCVRKGTVHALCGENGAGKSTLIKIINGAHKMDSGEIIYKGEKITPQNPRQMMELGIATIHQELSPVLEMTVAENIFLGREPKLKSGLLDVKKLYGDTQALMDEFHFSYDPRAKLKTLTISDMQLLEIVKAISFGASLIIMDEPTSSITEGETRLLFDNIKKLKAQGISIIYISHKMDEIFEICDDVTVFRDGKYVTTKPITELTKDKVIELMVGREITDVYPKAEFDIGDEAFRVENFTGKGFENVSFSVRKGEVLGFSGLVGAGRTELFRAVFGLDKFETGKLYLHGQEIRIKNVADAIKKRVIMTSENRKDEGLILCRSIKENVSLANLDLVKSRGFISPKKEQQTVAEMTSKLAVKMSSMNAPCSSLSGGNQQKVVLSKWLLQTPEVLILDEPTRGIDVGAKYEIYKLISDLAKQGIVVIVISSEMPELMGICDRIAVMSCGKLTGILNRDEFDQNTIMNFSMKGFEHE